MIDAMGWKASKGGWSYTVWLHSQLLQRVNALTMVFTFFSSGLPIPAKTLSRKVCVGLNLCDWSSAHQPER